MTPPEPTTVAPSKGVIVLAFAIIYIVWGSTYLGIRIVALGISPFLSAALRFVAAGLILLAWQRAKGEPWPSRPEWLAAALSGVFLLTLGNGGLSWAETRVPSGIAAIVIGTVPIWLSVFDAFGPRGSRLRWRVVLGLALGVAGVAVLAAPGRVGRIDTLGLLALLAAALAWSVGSMFSKRLARPSSLLQMAGMQMLCGGVALFALAGANGEYASFDPGAISATTLVALAYLIVFGSVVAFSAYSWLLSKVPASAVGSYAFVNPVIAVFIGTVFGNEALGPRTLIAGAFIVAAAALLTLPKPRRRQVSAGLVAESARAPD